MFDVGASGLRTRAATVGRLQLAIVPAYADGDSYAAVLAASCGERALTPGEIVSATIAADTRQHTIAGGTITLDANSGASPNLHIALIDTVSSEVLVVWDETNNQQLYVGNTANQSALVWTQAQPV
jgi:hypothetical protein